MVPAILIGKNVRQLTSPSTGSKIAVIASRGLVFSSWSPSPEELAGLNAGQPLWCIMSGAYIPEFQLIVGEESMIIPKDVRAEMLTGESPDVKEVVAKYQQEKDAIDYWSEWLARILSVVFFVLIGLFAKYLWSMFLG